MIIDVNAERVSLIALLQEDGCTVYVTNLQLEAASAGLGRVVVRAEWTIVPDGV